MMPLRPFEIHQPADLAQASDTLRELGDEASAYAGGTELLLAMKFDVLHYPHLVDIKKIPRLNSIEVTDDHLEIGATTTHYQLERSELVRSHLPVMAEMESRVANVRVRASGTIGGNLSFAEPHSDPATLLNVLDSSVVLQSTRDKREIPIGEFVIGAYETSLKRGRATDPDSDTASSAPSAEPPTPSFRSMNARLWDWLCYWRSPMEAVKLPRLALRSAV